jgi:putative ABC transport system permease protein
VGGIFVYQMMATDINKNLPEYATIKALGYPGNYLSRVVYAQGVLLALVGYLPGLAVSLVGYELTRTGAGIPIGMTAARLAAVLVMTLLMCLLSASVAVRIVQRANPADLF